MCPQCFHGSSCTGSSSMRKMLFNPFAASSSSTKEKKVDYFFTFIYWTWALYHLAQENIYNKLFVCCLTLLAEGSRGLCKHHFPSERKLFASWSLDSDLTQFHATLIFTYFFLPVSPDTPMLPSSLMLLNTAHEYLGRRSWCCNSDGALLKFYVSIGIVE